MLCKLALLRNLCNYRFLANRGLLLSLVARSNNVVHIVQHVYFVQQYRHGMYGIRKRARSQRLPSDSVCSFFGPTFAASAAFISR